VVLRQRKFWNIFVHHWVMQRQARPLSTSSTKPTLMENRFPFRVFLTPDVQFHGARMPTFLESSISLKNTRNRLCQTLRHRYSSREALCGAFWWTTYFSIKCAQFGFHTDCHTRTRSRDKRVQPLSFNYSTITVNSSFFAFRRLRMNRGSHLREVVTRRTTRCGLRLKHLAQ
jgi:hypothetical protein